MIFNNGTWKPKYNGNLVPDCYPFSSMKEYEEAVTGYVQHRIRINKVLWLPRTNSKETRSTRTE